MCTPTDASTPARAPRLAQTTSHSSASSRSSRHSLDLASHSSRSSYAHSHSHSYSSSPQPQPDTDTPDHSRAYSRTHTPSPATPALPAPTPRAQPAATVSTATATGTASRRAAGTPILGMTAYRERRQTLRGGSAESALSNRGPGPGPGAGAGRRTLIGEELRAAGLSPSKSRVGRGRLSLGWDAEEEAGGRALTALSLYVEGGARERERRREEREMRARERSLSRVRDDLVTPERERERERETTYTPSSASALARLRTTTGSSASASTSTSTSTTTAATPSPFGSRRHAPGHTEHTRLLGESLGMFEAQLARCGACGDTLKSAQGVVGAAARLNEMLRAGTARALGERVRAEVEGAGVGGTGAGAEEEVWGRVGAEYREGLRVSDELVRGLTGLFIGFGRVVREFSGGGAEGAQHARSASLDAEALGMGIGAARGRGSMSPDVGGSVGRGSSGAGSVSGSGRRSVESRRSWDASAALALREEVSKRLVARAESALGGASRPGTAFGALRERERERALDTPPQQAPLSAPRRLFTPREQREMQLGAGGGTPGSAGGGMPTIHSQETLYGAYEPSPTPASRVATGAGAGAGAAADRSRALPPLGIPKPLPSLPSETASRRTGTSSIVGATQETGASAGPSRARDRETRKVSSASTSTVRGSGSGSTSTPGSAFPVTAPAGATTAVTPHTVSTQAAGRTAFPALPRTDSDRSVRASVAFSRASTVSSVSALVDVRRQDARRRTESSGGGGGELSASASEGEGGSGSPVSAAPVAVPAAAAAFAARQREWEREREAQSGSETERPGPPRRTQVGKMTLDAKGKGTGTGNAQDRSAVVAANAIVAAKMGISGGRGPQSSASGVGVVKRERRRTVTDIWPQD
ncbi:hypothetical protein C0993_001851 [Termitomyces sp. T159_Od127]|nr:hypothetical protein C0993_001851 [Termitomyces sp. T159_Od127]